MTIADIETEHADYTKYKRERELIAASMDEYDIKRQCIADQGGETSYLKKPVSHSRPSNPDKEKKLYEEYVEHAYMPEHIVADAFDEMSGICFKIEPTVMLPDKIKHLQAHANTRGDSLNAVAKQVLSDLIMSKKAGVSTDYRNDQSVIEHKESASLINWRRNSAGYSMMVFSEQYLDAENNQKEQRRHYELVDNILVVTVYRQDDENGKWAEHEELDENNRPVPQPSLPNNKPYDYIPVRIAETKRPALLGMARTVMKGFKISADYYGMLHTLTPTVVIKTDKSVDAMSVGHENGIKVGQGDDVTLLQQGTDGADPLRVAMENQFNSAVDQGVRLISESSAAEAENTVYMRNASKQIKIDVVAQEASTQIEEALRVAAILENANPDDVTYEMNVELIATPVDVQTLKEMREAVVDSGLIKHEDYLIKLQANNLVMMNKSSDGSYDTEKYIAEVEQEHTKRTAEPEAV